jgi:UDP-3-O-[3-hydroxymyristoyl] glucosamine N-acyltransferase
VTSKIPKKQKPGGRRRGPPVARSFTLGELAGAVGGTVVGDPSRRLTGVAALKAAGPEDLSWAADDRHRNQAERSRAGALLVRSPEDAAGKDAVVVAAPTLALASWLEIFQPPARPPAGVSPGARVHRTARLGRGVSVAAGATVAARACVGARTVLSSGAYVGEGAEIGEDSYVHPNAAVLERCRVGSRCILHAGAVVGSDGFGFVWDGQRHRKIPQVGIVRVEDDVEIGANSCVDRATLGETVIGRGTKIDNLVQIGHNVIVGENAILCGQVGLAGSARLGNRVTLGGQSGVGDHVAMGDGATGTARAGVASTVPEGAVVSGMPAVPHREYLRRKVMVARLPNFVERLEALEKRLENAQKQEGERPWSSESPKS